MTKQEKLTHWEILAKPPKTALEQIKGGRLSGMTDVNPQWRYKAMHDVFGPCGTGWKYAIDRIWTENGASGQVFMFVQVSVQVANGDKWSDPIPGVGGSMLLETQKGSLHHNDEAVKMATTDALSVALKMLGVAADIYMGRWDGSKYKDDPQTQSEQMASAAAEKGVTPTAGAMDNFSDEEQKFLADLAKQVAEAMEIDVRAAITILDKSHLENEEKIAVWSLLDSKTRSAIKKAKAENTATEMAAQA